MGTKVVKLDNTSDILSEAIDWIIQIEDGISDEKQSEFNDWLELSPCHQRIYHSANAPIQQAEMLSGLSELFPYQSVKRKNKQTNHIMRGLAFAAASIMLVMVINITGFEFDRTTPQSPVVVKQKTDKPDKILFEQYYSTHVGEQSVIELPDSSVLRLNTATVAKVIFTEKRRLVYLHTGELYIDVAHNKERVLAVIANKKIIEAVGTAFNVSLEDSSFIELTVTEGEVKVSNTDSTKKIQPVSTLVNKANKDKSKSNTNNLKTDNSLSVKKGEKVSISKDATSLTDIKKELLKDEELKSILAWHEQNLLFNGEPLHYVVGELSRYTGIEFEIVDNDLYKIPIVGRFGINNLDSTFEILEVSFGIKATKTQSGKIQLTLKH